MSKWCDYLFLLCAAYLFVWIPYLPAAELHSSQPVPDWRTEAQASIDKNDPAAAEQIYLTVITGNAGTWDAFDAYKKLICLQIQKNRSAEADSNIEKFTAMFGTHEQFGMAVKEIADAYLYQAREYAKAGRLYQEILNRGAEKKESMWAYRGLAVVNIKQSNTEPASQAAVRLVNDYSDQLQYGMALKEVADAYMYDARDAFEAAKLYQIVLDSRPNPYHAMWACRGAAIANIKLGMMDAAESATKRLMTDFTDQPMIDMALKEVADAWFYHVNDLDKAGRLYQAILDNKPSDRFAMWALRGLAMVSIKQGKTQEAQTVVARLLTEYSGCSEISRAVKEVIDQYCWSGYGPETLALSQALQSKRPDAQSDLLALSGLAQGYVFLGQDDKVDEILDRIASQYARQERAAYAVFVIGEGYFKQAESLLREGKQQPANQAFNRAIAVWEKNQSVLADTPFDAIRVYYTGAAYQYQRQHNSSIAAFKEAIRMDPNSIHNPNMMRLMGISYVASAKDNLCDPNVAAACAESLWQTILDKYPDDPMSFDAAMRLAWIQERKGQWLQAARAYEFFLAHCRKDPRKIKTIYTLANAYEQAGEKDAAKAAYTEYIQAAPTGDKYIPQAAKALLRLAGIK